MGCVRAAQVAASGSSLEGHHPAAGTHAEDGEEDDDDGSDGGGSKGEGGGKRTKKTKIRMPMNRERIKSRVSVRSARTYDPSRLGPTVVYDPSDRISRFHPRYEVLVEAGSFYLQVRPDLLHDKVEELDAILIEQAKRSLRRQEAPTGFKVWEGLEKDERRRRRARARKESEARERHAQHWMGNVSRKRRRQLVREMMKREREEEEQRELLLRGEEEEEEEDEEEDEEDNDEEEEGACMMMGLRPEAGSGQKSGGRSWASLSRSGRTVSRSEG
ncbi:unnamed protein product [Ectocarpus sp. 8 AP-2014]